MGGTITPDLQRLVQPIAPPVQTAASTPPKVPSQSDQFSNEDLAALTETYRHLSDAKDPRAEKLRSFIGQQADSILHPEQAPDPRGLIHRAWDWANRGLISKDTVVKAMTGMSPEDLDKALAPRAEDTPWQAAQSEFWRGVMQDTAGVSSGLTSPLTAATVGLGAAGKLPGTAGTLARAAAVPTSIAFAGQGASQALEPGLANTPGAWQQRLQGLSMAAGGAAGALDPAAVTASRAAIEKTAGAGLGLVRAGTGEIVRSVAPEPTDAMVTALTRGQLRTTKGVDMKPIVEGAMPDLKTAEAASGRPVQNVDDAIAITNSAKKNLWGQYQQKLGPNASTTVDGNEIADAIMDSIDARQARINPGLAERVKTMADTYRRPFTLGELEDSLQSANTDLNSYYAKNKVGRRVAEGDPETAAIVAESDQLRKSLYSKLDELPDGEGAADLKKRYGNLMSIEESLLRARATQARQSPMSLGEQIATARGLGKVALGGLTTAGGVLAGEPHMVGGGLALAGGGVVEAGVGRWLKARQTTDALIKNAFENYGKPPSMTRTLLTGTRGEAGLPGTVREEDETVVPAEMRRTPQQTQADIRAAMARDPNLAGIAEHERNMAQRADEAAAQRQALGPLGLESQRPTITPPPGPEMKAQSYYQEPEIRAEQPNAPTFYSKAEKAAQSLPGSATGQQMLATLRNQGVKPSELEQLGIEDFLKSKGKFTRQEVADFIAKNKLQVGRKDLVNAKLTDPPETRYSASPKYESYTLPGEKQNYTERLFTLPEKAPESAMLIPKGASREGYTLEDKGPSFRAGDRFHVRDTAGRSVASSNTAEQAWNNFDARAAEGLSADYGRFNQPKTFQSSHWDEPNVLAHSRFDERVTADGKKALFLEEAQSDWHQQGKKEGYIGGQANYEMMAKAIGQFKRFSNPNAPSPTNVAADIKAGLERGQSFLNAAGDAGLNVEESRILRQWNEDYNKKGVPDAPFKTDWHELVVKDALREAAERGMDKLAWTTGDQQADRYDLSKKTGKIGYGTTDNSLLIYDQRGKNVVKRVEVAPDKLAEYVGKDAADKLLNSPLQKMTGYTEISGDNLKVGGEWAKALYDRAIPNFLNRYAKKWGAKVGESTLGGNPGLSRDEWFEYNKLRTQINQSNFNRDRWNELEEKRIKEEPSQKVHSIDITPAMRRAILKEGQPIASAATFGDERAG